MKRLALFFLAFFFLLPKLADAQIGFSGEHIERFHSDIKLNSDGTINVTESIRYDFGSEERHGIYRNIPFTKYDEENTRFDLKFDDFSVTDEVGNGYELDLSRENEQIILKIGDPEKTISGTHTYNISYTVSGAVGYFDEYDELYWNATGTSWDVVISTASALVTLPENIDTSKIQTKCFTGNYGSTDKNCATYINNNTIHYHSTSTLNPNSGLTVLTSLPNNAIAYLPPEKYVLFWETPLGMLSIALLILTGLIWYLALPIFLIIRYFKTGRDPDVGRAVTALYEAPKTKSGRALSPTETGGLVDENVDTRDIFAAIIDLARRGYINIKEAEKKKFTLIFANKPKAKDKLQPFEQELLDGIFEGKKEVKLKDVKFYKTVQSVEKTVYENLVKEGYFNSNPKTTRTKYYALGGVALATFNIFLAFVAFFFGRVMPRKTLFGAQSANVGRGIKNFLSSQERQLNYQGDKQMFFEKLLPFAVAFGVEKNWAERFKGFDLHPPNWYQGISSSHFNSAILVSSLSDSYKGFSASSTPSSSSGSGFSSGGGFSGGGGGGGGGGSW